MTSDAAALLVGGIVNSGTQTNSFTGMIDEVRIYDQKLSLSELAALYNAAVPEPAAGLDVFVASLVLGTTRRIRGRSLSIA